MNYVIYHKESTLLAPLHKKSFATERSAKAALTRGLNDGHMHNRADWAIAEAAEFFCRIEKKRTVTNLMTGNEVEIAVNTPRSCDPSSELYWSM